MKYFRAFCLEVLFFIFMLFFFSKWKKIEMTQKNYLRLNWKLAQSRNLLKDFYVFFSHLYFYFLFVRFVGHWIFGSERGWGSMLRNKGIESWFPRSSFGNGIEARKRNRFHRTPKTVQTTDPASCSHRTALSQWRDHWISSIRRPARFISQRCRANANRPDRFASQQNASSLFAWDFLQFHFHFDTLLDPIILIALLIISVWLCWTGLWCNAECVFRVVWLPPLSFWN